jgi:YidC/Oxa1 family membrane protein insertase
MTDKMIEYIRYTLYALLIITAFYLYQAWDKEHPKPDTTTTQTEASATAINNYVPEIAQVNKNTATQAASANTTTEAAAVSTTGQLIHIATDVINVDIDTVGGNIVQIQMLKYPQELNSSTPFVLLNNSPDNKYIAQSGLLSTTGPDTSKGQVLYTTTQTQYSLENNQNELQVKLNWQNKQGINVTKVFTFHRNSYEIGVAYQVENQTEQPWQGNLYLQLLRTNTPPANAKGFISLSTYFGAAISSPEKPYQKVSFKQMQETPLNQTVTGGWAAMIQHYFVSAWVPESTAVSQYFSKVTPDGLYAIGMIGPQLTVEPGKTATVKSKFYAGPSITKDLEKVAPGLQLTIDYGWFWFISIAIFWMMQQIYNLIGNWGWSIVLVTLIIKLMFYQLSAKSYRSMSVLKKLQPRLTTLKEKFGDDKQKFTQATLELYRKEKVNPMSGCLPILIQIPVFIGLYWVLIESVELRQAPFILWIHDLTLKDPYYVLPVLMGISMFLQQRLNPPPPDPMQAKVMMFMPVIFTALFINFPAGLMLYWFVNNTLSFLQQWYIMRSINGNEKQQHHKKTK